MDIRRIVLYGALFFVMYNLWSLWHQEHPNPIATISAPSVQQSSDDRILPASIEPSNTVTKATVEAVPASLASKIEVQTDIYHLTIDTRHGDIINTQLLKYPLSSEQKNVPVQLLYDEPTKKYIANSSLFTNNGQAVKDLNFNFTASAPRYEMAEGEQQLKVTLNGQDSNGLQVKKEFVFTRDNYAIQVNYTILNNSPELWQGYLNTQLVRTESDEKTSMFGVGAYTGASYGSPGHHRYQKVSFKDMNKANLNEPSKGGWVAMQQHYFLSAWVPTGDTENTFYSRVINGNYTIGVVSHPISIAPNQEKTITSTLYLGPEDTTVLAKIAPGLDMTVDYGILWIIASPLFKLLSLIHDVVGNWGWAIVLLTVLIKLAFYRLSARSYRSMAGMRELQPKLLSLKERFGDDKAKLSQATMELYRQEKVNPLGGCLPILVQIPVFIALYWVLLESVELRLAPFMLWIKDLSAADPYYLLPVIMGITMLIQQRLNPAPPDPMQAKMMMLLPVVFTFLFLNFPAGLVLYWIVNNTLSILQQWYITQKYSRAPKTTR